MIQKRIEMTKILQYNFRYHIVRQGMRTETFMLFDDTHLWSGNVRHVLISFVLISTDFMGWDKTHHR